MQKRTNWKTRAVFESDLESPRRVASEAFGRAARPVKELLADAEPGLSPQESLREMCRRHSEKYGWTRNSHRLEAAGLKYSENGGSPATVFSEGKITCLGELEARLDERGHFLYSVATVENAGFSRARALGFRQKAEDYLGIGGHLNGMMLRHTRGNYLMEPERGIIELMNGHVDSRHGNYVFRFFAGNFKLDGSSVRCDYHMVIEGEVLTGRSLGAIHENGGTLERHLKKEFEKMGAAARKMFPSELWERVRLDNVISR